MARQIPHEGNCFLSKSGFGLRLQPQLYQPADGFGPAGQIILISAPIVDFPTADVMMTLGYLALGTKPPTATYAPELLALETERAN